MLKKIAEKLVVAATFVSIGASMSFAETRILAYGDSNTWGWIPVEQGFPTTRYSDSVRWPGVLEDSLRLDDPVSKVLVDGLTSRTVNTAYRDPQNGIDGQRFNGLANIDASVAEALPLDVVVIMLGTNDARSDIASKPEQVADDIAKMVERVRDINGGVGSTYAAPKVLIIAPPSVGDTSKTPISGIMKGSDVRSKEIAAAILAKAASVKFDVLDAASIVSIKSIDGVHMDPKDHKILGEAIAAKVKQLLPK
jgi:lysophospholipase L1-like esterase